MSRYVCILVIAFSLSWEGGCAHKQTQVAEQTPIAPYQQFVSQNVDWTSIRRVVLMPLANQTAYPKVSAELQANLAAELQRTGRFEIVVATNEDPGARARDVFRQGQFDEIELLRIAREYQAQAILFGNVTQYHPYSPPRVGFSLLLVSPAEGVAIASADGLWDAREAETSTQALTFYKQSLDWPQRVLGSERVLESPEVYQRFVCHQIAASLSSSGMQTVTPAGGTVPESSSENEIQLSNPPPVPGVTESSSE